MTATDQDLITAANTRVLFGHQSVGANILDAIPGVYRELGLKGPGIVEAPVASSQDGGFIAHALLGTNGDPASKMRGFETLVRANVADVDAALMKFCYIDVDRDTDVEDLFEQYRRTIEGLSQAYPDITFLYTTVPLTTERSWKGDLKAILGRDDRMGPADNAARERYNSLVRDAFGSTDRLVDIALVQSTAPDGTRVSGAYRGQRYYALHGGYASDPGHLNALGANSAASALLGTIAHNAKPPEGT